MTCPKCHSPMQTFNRQGIHIEQCAGCGGIFLDRGELEQIMTAEQRHYAAPPPYPGGYSDSPPPYQGHRDSPPPYQRHRDSPPPYHPGHAPQHGHYKDSPPPYGRKGRKRSFLEELFD
ncbi:zf-TFIIB domain-containing protein [Actinoallomurus sp. CA-150999]|uniref:TFIIB-type zinc ribbon-containing protein n=1 Tax=Actinoallomurus sp. CA-150999 TaxID=3239887 RepID=UPI003D909985